MSEIDDLKAIVSEDWYALCSPGDECDGFETVATYDGDDHRWFTEVYVITLTPNGVLLRWRYDRGLTEMQETEFDSFIPIVPVNAVDRVVTVTDYVEVSE